MEKEFTQINANEINKNTFSLIGQDWMLVTAKKNDKVNTMTASWGGFGVLWGKNVAYIVIRPQRYTKEFVDFSDSFSLTFFDDSYKKKLSYLGTVSGKDEDKISKCSLTTVYKDDIPYFYEANLVLFCKKLYATNINENNFIDKEVMSKCYPDKDYHTLYIAEITSVYEQK